MKFNDLLEKNKFYDLHKMTGLKSDLVLLKSGRILKDTSLWNPMVFAFVYDQQDVIKYLTNDLSRYDLRLCL